MAQCMGPMGPGLGLEQKVRDFFHPSGEKLEKPGKFSEKEHLEKPNPGIRENSLDSFISIYLESIPGKCRSEKWK